MKFLSIFAPIAFAVAASAMPAEDTSDATSHAAVQAASACGASGSCHGFGGEELCNDRCKRCYGPSGYYGYGECCGFGWQACCCYYG